jgi:hypothetical protein
VLFLVSTGRFAEDLQALFFYQEECLSLVLRIVFPDRFEKTGFLSLRVLT